MTQFKFLPKAEPYYKYFFKMKLDVIASRPLLSIKTTHFRQLLVNLIYPYSCLYYTC